MSPKKLLFEMFGGKGRVRGWTRGSEQFLTLAHTGEHSYKKVPLQPGREVKIVRVDAHGNPVQTTVFKKK